MERVATIKEMLVEMHREVVESTSLINKKQDPIYVRISRQNTYKSKKFKNKSTNVERSQNNRISHKCHR